MIQVKLDSVSKKVVIESQKEVAMKTASALVKIQKRLQKNGYKVHFKSAS